MDRVEVEGWVSDTNVERLFESLARWIGYDFGELDWQAIDNALRWTDGDRADRWYEYPLGGKPPLDVAVADNPGDGVVSVRITGAIDTELKARIETAFEFLSE
jgi:hypothetical protein